MNAERKMRAKMRVTAIISTQDSKTENLHFGAVYKNGAYPDDGSDEDNTFAKFTPSAHMSMQIANPALLGTFEVGQTFYVDFIPVS